MLTVALAATPVEAVTQDEVDAACADSAAAYRTFSAAQGEFAAAAGALEETTVELEEAEYREQRVRGLYQNRQSDQTELQSDVESQAAEMYMQGVAGAPAMMLFSTPAEALTAVEFLNQDASDNLETINDLNAISGELDRLGAELGAVVGDLTVLRDLRQTTAANQEAAMASALGAYDQLSSRCQEVQAEYQAEQARIREEEIRQSQDQAGGGPTRTIDGIRCPFTPGRTQFINSWGAPRSGGRSHQGSDMFAPWDEPVYAVSSGSVRTANGGLGGKTIWLTSNGGTGFYYAHLNGFAVTTGQTVQQGDLIGYNGNSGNASGGPPHVHFQIHPNGPGGAAVNPYPTVASVCF